MDMHTTGSTSGSHFWIYKGHKSRLANPLKELSDHVEHLEQIASISKKPFSNHGPDEKLILKALELYWTVEAEILEVFSECEEGSELPEKIYDIIGDCEQKVKRLEDRLGSIGVDVKHLYLNERLVVNLDEVLCLAAQETKLTSTTYT